MGHTLLTKYIYQLQILAVMFISADTDHKLFTQLYAGTEICALNIVHP